MSLLSNHQSSRTMSGNVTLLSALIGGLIGFSIIVGLGFYLILSHQQRGRAACDQLSMTLSKSLNAGDRIGQMNATVEHSRELVYLSRENVNLANGLGVPAYQMLAAQLLQEARASADTVDNERLNQIKLAMTESQSAIKTARGDDAKNPKDDNPKGVFIMPWLFEMRPEINEVKFGWIKDTLSSVESPQVLGDLQAYDLKQKYVEPTSKLFRGNVNAKLPSPDEDLPFHFASLTAEVKKIDAPPRLVNADVFMPTATIFNKKDSTHVEKPTEIPSAVQVAGSIGIKTGQKTQLDLKVVSSATANSALQAP